MAVPKKRTSKSRTNIRRSQWKGKAHAEAQKALDKAKIILASLKKSETKSVD